MKVFVIKNQFGQYLQWSVKGIVWGAFSSARKIGEEKSAKKLANDYDGTIISLDL